MSATEGMARQVVWLRCVEDDVRRLATDPDHRVVRTDLMRLWREGYSVTDAVRKYLSDHHLAEGS